MSTFKKKPSIASPSESIQVHEDGTFEIQQGSGGVPCPPPAGSFCSDIQVNEDGSVTELEGCKVECGPGKPIKANPCEEVWVQPGPPPSTCTLKDVCERTDALVEDLGEVEGRVDVLRGDVDNLQEQTDGLAGDVAYILDNCCDPTPGGTDFLIVDDVSSLRALNVATLGGINLIKVLGYAAASDGGDFECYYDAASVATVDDGIVFAPNAGPGRFIQLGF